MSRLFEKKAWTLVLAVAIVFCLIGPSVSPAYDEVTRERSAVGYMGHKLGRGVINIFTGWMEIPKTIATKWKETDPATGFFLGGIQGIGWGYRADWFPSGPGDYTNWMGGFGALVDLGEGNDEHYADCMSMGQGFVYGFGLLYDGGGDDIYRTFWWGPAASAHMGVGALIEEDGNDDIHVTRLSGGYGYDCSVGWLVDNGGNDVYGGQFNYGRAYTYGMTFMVNDGGDDVYNNGEEQTDPRFGVVDHGFTGANLAGVFIDLGGGTDTYNTSIEGVGNDAYWYLDPVGEDVDPAVHKGVGIDK